jgi:hypothetical protein
MFTHRSDDDRAIAAAIVGPPKRRGWREIVWFRPLTPSTYAALVMTRRGRLVSILPAGGPRVLSDYLAWPYDFREVDTRERLLMLISAWSHVIAAMNSLSRCD